MRMAWADAMYIPGLYEGHDPLRYANLTMKDRYCEDCEYCPKCSGRMEWQEFNNSEAGHFFDAHCTSCGFTDGT